VLTTRFCYNLHQLCPRSKNWKAKQLRGLLEQNSQRA